METPIFTDQMGRTVLVKSGPLRIVSLVPSQTELLYALGLDKEVVAQTLFCIHPKEQHIHKPRIGGTKNLHIQKIRELKPDLLIGNKEENDQEQMEILMQEFPVWMSDIHNLEEALDMIQKLGLLLDKPKEANGIVKEIRRGFQGLVRTETQKSCLYLIWRDPWMAAGKDTFIQDMIHHMGLQNLAFDQNGRYPAISLEWIREKQPDCILLSSEPYPFKESHVSELQAICKNSQIELVDGEMFSWYGSRLILAAPYLKALQEQL